MYNGHVDAYTSRCKLRSDTGQWSVISTAAQHSTVVYLHDMTTNIITREIRQKNHANEVLEEVENL